MSKVNVINKLNGDYRYVIQDDTLELYKVVFRESPRSWTIVDLNTFKTYSCNSVRMLEYLKDNFNDFNWKRYYYSSEFTEGMVKALVRVPMDTFIANVKVTEDTYTITFKEGI